MPEPDHKLIANLRALIERDPEGYVAKRLPYVIERLQADLRTDLTGRSEDATVTPRNSRGEPSDA